jgi:hypothetical protein
MTRRTFDYETGFYDDEIPSEFWEKVKRENLSSAQIEENERLHKIYLDRIEAESVLPDGSARPGSWAWREAELRNA